MWPGAVSQPFPPLFGAPPGPAARHDPFAVTGLALAVLALVLLGVLAGVVSGPVALVGLVLSAVGVIRAHRSGARVGVAVAGVATSSIAIVLAFVALVVFGTLAQQNPFPEGADASAAGTGYQRYPLISLRPGEPATVGEYTVTVDSIELDADAVLAADPANPRPEGRYVQAVVTVVYEGSGTGVVADDLAVAYIGSSDEWSYDQWSCAARTDRPVDALPGLVAGDRATYTVCMDVPSDAVEDVAVSVEDLDTWAVDVWGTR